MKRTLSLLLCLFLLSKAQAQTVTIAPHATGFNWLVGVQRAPGDARLYAFQKDGFIKIVNPDGSVNPTPFLDISAKVNNSSMNEQGLVGLAFHPNYQANGFFYVFYNQIGTGTSTISRYKRSPGNPNIADPTEGVLLTWEHPLPNHVGGCMKFGPDGYLYIGTGDGGGAGDPSGNSQNLLSFHGKILRLDVGNTGGAYTVPADNPFVGVANTAPEIWAYGLRNPWRFSFDRFTGELWIGDVGQDEREEVNYQPANSPGGENYGWSCKEGTLDFNPNQCFAGSVYTDPLFEYNHDGQECSVTGGVVYRGTKYADLFGKYLFTDFCAGKIWTLQNDGVPTVAEVGNFNDNDFTALEEDNAGELYLVGFNNNTIYKLTSSNCAPVAWLVAEPNITLPLGGSVQLNVYGNDLNYQWMWNGNPLNGATSSALTVSNAGTYSVVVTNPANGCSSTSNTTVVTAPAPLAASVSVQNVSCFDLANGTATAVATGGTQNYSYLWGNGATTATITGLAPGAYTVTVSDGNSSVTATATVTQPAAELFIDFDLIAPTELTAPDGAVWAIPSGGTPPYQFLWEDGTVSDTLNNIMANVQYIVTVTDANGCIGENLFILFWDATENPEQLTSLALYPNPVAERLHVTLELAQSAHIGIAIFDGTGRQLSTLLPYGQNRAGTLTVEASTAALPPGTYFVLINVEGEMVAKKLVKL